MTVAHVRHVKRPKVVYVDMATMIPDGMRGVEEGYHNDGWRAGRPTIVEAEYATMIPDGMHAAPAVDNSQALSSTVRKLIASGVSEEKARILVHRAHRRHLGKHRRRAGMGDATATDNAAAVLASITADAKTVQDAHKRMIDTMAGWEERNPGWVNTDDDLRRTFQDQLTALKNAFVQRALPLLGVEFPYQIDRTDPAGAIVLAVRDDIAQTADLLDQRKVQQLLQRNIAELQKIPLPSAPPSITLNVPEIPWYVWAGGAGVGLLALHQMLKK